MISEHDFGALPSFQEGERRFVFAAHRDGGPLIELRDGEADERRAFTRAVLSCPVPGCKTPAITTVSRDRGRDGYRHLATNAAEHSPESLFHLEGKAQVARWLRVQFPGAEVVEERRTDDAGTRVADVLAVLPDGRRIAVEIQYAALAPRDWIRRHESYRSQGIVDVWLFGHTGPQLRSRLNRVYLNPTHRSVIEAGEPLLWFNPLQLRIGRITNRRTVRGQKFTVHGDEAPAQFEAAPLADYEVSGGGKFVSDRSKELDEATAAWQAALDAALAEWEGYRARQAALEARRAAEEAERAEEEARRLEAQAQKIAAENAREEEEARQRNDLAARAAEALEERQRRSTVATPAARYPSFDSWYQTSAGGRALEEFPDWPEWLDVQTAYTSVPSRIWQWTVWDRLIRGRAGTILREAEIRVELQDVFQAHFQNEQRARSAVFTFTNVLRDAGVIIPVERGAWWVVGRPRNGV